VSRKEIVLAVRQAEYDMPVYKEMTAEEKLRRVGSDYVDFLRNGIQQLDADFWLYEYKMMDGGQVRLLLEGNFDEGTLYDVVFPHHFSMLENYPSSELLLPWFDADSVVTDLIDAGALPDYEGYESRAEVDSILLAERYRSFISERHGSHPFPLFQLLQTKPKAEMYGDEALIGHVRLADTALLNTYLRHPKVTAVLPDDFSIGYRLKEAEPVSLMGLSFASFEPFSDTKKLEDRLVMSDSTLFDVLALRKAEKAIEVTGQDIHSANANHLMEGQVALEIFLQADGGNRFGLLTKRNVGKRIALVLDAEVIGNPMIVEPIPTGRFVITGGFGIAQAQQWAKKIKDSREHFEVTLISSKDLD
jgi:hypothetical protein